MAGLFVKIYPRSVECHCAPFELSPGVEMYGSIVGAVGECRGLVYLAEVPPFWVTVCSTRLLGALERSFRLSYPHTSSYEAFLTILMIVYVEGISLPPIKGSFPTKSWRDGTSPGCVSRAWEVSPCAALRPPHLLFYRFIT